MQIFITSRKAEECAQNLDTKRLFKQIIEAHQVLDIISGSYEKKGWQNHPIVAQWKPYRDFLIVLINAFIKEMKTRKTKKGKPYNLQNDKFNEIKTDTLAVERPPFMDDEQILSNHRANLIRKCRENPVYSPWYIEKLGWKEKEANGYIWVLPHPKIAGKFQKVQVSNVLTLGGKTKSIRKVLE